MERKTIGPKIDLVVDRERTSAELEDMIEQLSADTRLSKSEQQFLEQVSDTLITSLTRWEIKRLEEMAKKYSN